MNDVVIKKEKGDNDGDIGDSLPEITKLLEEVKREEDVSSDESDFLDDFFNDGGHTNSSIISENANIQELQELLERKKRELRAADEEAENIVHESQSSSPSTNKSLKQKNPRRRKSGEEQDGKRTKRKRKSRSRSHSPRRNAKTSRRSRSMSPSSHNKSVVSQTSVSPSPISSSIHQQSLAINENPTRIVGALSAELEIANLLKAEDYNSDGEPQNFDQGIDPMSSAGAMYGFSTVAPIYDPACQMVANIPPNSYPLSYNMVAQPSFYTAHLGNLPLMGYGIPQMNIPVDQNEVQCLPVVNNAGFFGLPAFKRIKLERNLADSTEDINKGQVSAEDRRRTVFEKCTTLLEQLEIVEQTGKFIFTSTVAKLNTGIVTNSIVQKITNVSYEFQSIGPTLNLTDWGLREISNRNVGIAKKIAISADEYFAKIAENADTIARKLIKVEDAKADKNKEEIDMEVELEEPTLSTFLKNSMTQTDAVICKECVARKRIVGHNIGVQATVCTGDIGSQTSLATDDSVRLASGLNTNQLKALYEFSSLIREPSKSSSNALRESLMEIYNLSQHRSVPNISSFLDYSPPRPPNRTHSSVRDPRTDSASIMNPSRFKSPGKPIPSFIQSEGPYFRHPNFNSYQPHTIQEPRHQSPAMRMPSNQPEYQLKALQDVPRSYGRGSQPR